MDKAQQTTPSPLTLFRSSLAVITLLWMTGMVRAQVSDYAFQTTIGAYAPITGGTVLASGTGMDNGVFAVALPGTFWFSGTTYSTIYVSCNGFITVGSAPTVPLVAALSAAQTYAGALAPFATNLKASNNGSAELRWQQVGREVVVQWKDVRRAGSSGAEQFSFQARLHLDNGRVNYVYGPVLNIGNDETDFPQIGLRGPNNTFPTNVNNRLIGTTNDWISSTPGTSNNSRCRFTGRAPWRKPTPGLTFTFAWSTGMELELTTDNIGSQTSWQVRSYPANNVICSGSGYANNTTYFIPCLAASGQYRLVVKDSGSNGLCCVNGSGGYVLRDLFGRRIIDQKGDAAFTDSSTVSLPFDMPLGKGRMTDATQDQVHLFPSQNVQALPDADVQAQFGIGNQNDDGYEFWFFNPNGGYSRRLFKTHAANNYMFPAGPDRCSYVRIDFITTNPLPINTMLNVKVRSVVNNVRKPWGEATRLKVDLPALCPDVHLIDSVGTSLHSCGITNVPLNGSKWLRATFIPSAHKYKFAFTAPGYYREIISTTNSSLLMVRWGTMPLQYNTTYQVKVATSYDLGATWCPWGQVCTITTGPATPGNDRTAEVEEPQFVENTAELRVWPNPSVGGPISIALNGLGNFEGIATGRLFDAAGRNVLIIPMQVSNGSFTGAADLSRVEGKGLYTLVVEAGTERLQQRLVIE